MPRLIDQDAIRARLRTDPIWGVYALGDLEPAMFPKTLWFEPDLTLVLHAFGTCILFAMGAGSVREALDHVTWPVRLQVRQDALDEIARHVTISATQVMWRMGRRGAAPRTGGANVRLPATRLTAADVTAIEALYADGATTGESPEFFFPSMVTDGVFVGAYDDGALVAVAGTHLLSRREGVAAIGNIYTRRDRRGRGLGRLVTAAVLDELGGIDTVALNVRADNAAAVGLYESLGFSRHCRFYEAVAGTAKGEAVTPGAPLAPKRGFE